MPRQQVRLSDAIEEFIASRRAQGYAERTIKNYRLALGRLLESVGNIYVESITERHIDGYFGMNSTRWAPGTMNLMRAHLVAFFGWCRQRRYMTRDNDPMATTRRRREPRRDKLRVPVTEFSRLLDTATFPRNRMVIAIGLYLFLRSSEIRTLQLKHLHLDMDEIAVTVHKRGGEVDRMPVSSPLRIELNRWLTFYAEQVGELKPDYYLVPSLKHVAGYYDYERGHIMGRKSDERALRPERMMSEPHAVVNQVLDAAGYETFREGCHTLRRSGARALFDELAEDASNDRALEIVSSMLHHVEMGTTQLYLGIEGSRAKRDQLLKGRQLFKINDANVAPLRVVGSD